MPTGKGLSPPSNGPGLNGGGGKGGADGEIEAFEGLETAAGEEAKELGGWFRPGNPTLRNGSALDDAGESGPKGDDGSSAPCNLSIFPLPTIPNGRE